MPLMHISSIIKGKRQFLNKLTKINNISFRINFFFQNGKIKILLHSINRWSGPLFLVIFAAISNK